MPTYIDKFSEISDNYQVLICDLWGCLHDGKVSFEKALQALKTFRENNGLIVLVTNAPRSQYSVEKQINKLGINKSHYDLLLTSGELTSELLGTNHKNKIKSFHIGITNNHSVFENIKRYNKTLEIEIVTLADAEIIVCTEPFNPVSDTLDNYNDILSEGVKRGLPFVCSNPDLVVDIGDKRELCAGSIAERYESLGGQTSYLGKPHSTIYEKVYQFVSTKIELEKNKFLCVGDGINTDIKGAGFESLDSLLIIGGLLRNDFLIKRNRTYFINEKGLNKYLLMNDFIEPTFAMKFFE